MAKFNTKTVRTSARTTNAAGGVAYKHSPKVELIHAVLTTFLEDKFYESGNDRLTRIQELVRNTNPEFAARLAVIARKEYHLRSVPQVLLGEIALNYTGDDLVKRAIIASAERPDDLTELASYVKQNSNDGVLTKQTKRGIRNALLKFSPYQLAKYRGEGKEMSLVDLFNLVHPKVELASKEQKKAWKALIEGNLKSSETWESKLSNADSDEERTDNLEALILEDKMGYMAMLRNLNNFIKYGISAKAKKIVCKKLTDVEEVRNSKQLPFRFATAYEQVADREYKDAISEALDISVENVPKFKGKTLIAVDVSGSMSGQPMRIASIFAAALMKANKNADVILVDTEAKPFNESSRIPVIDLAQKMQSHLGGGTDMSQVFDYAHRNGIKYDRVFMLSDNESWVDGYHGGPTQTYKQYCAALKTEPYVYCIDIQGYGTKDINVPKAFHFTGWSERILDFVSLAEQGESLVEYIENYEL